MDIEGALLPEGACGPDAWNGNTLLVKSVVDLMYADPIDEPELVAEAISICGTCVVRAECLEAGIDERYGVWGGLTARERDELRRERRRIGAA